MAKPASGQMTPRTSQCSGRESLAGMRVAETILTSLPKGLAARSVHCSAGPAAVAVETSTGNNQSVFMTFAFELYN